MATALKEAFSIANSAMPAWGGDREIQIARRVQSRLLPDTRPRLESLECDGVMVPAGGVGGDYFDFIVPRPGQLAMVIADISGHGVPAALMMASLHALLRSQYAFGDGDLAKRLVAVNRLFSEFTGDGHYATLFVGEYDEVSRCLRYANCGHPAPYLLRAGGAIERLEATATVIGAFPSWSAETKQLALEPGDGLFMFTDGIVEAADARGEQYGDRRLEHMLRDTGERDLTNLAWRIVGDVREHCGGRLDDDLTVVAARRPVAGRR